MGLKYRRKQSRKRWCGDKIPLIAPKTINERWSMDFVSDSLSDGCSFRVFNVIDDYSREAIVQHVDFSIGGLRLVRVFEEIKRYRCLPKQLVCDNGTEFTSNAFRK
jgi:putative transposase